MNYDSKEDEKSYELERADTQIIDHLIEDDNKDNSRDDLPVTFDVMKNKILPFLEDDQQLDYASRYNVRATKYNKSNPTNPPRSHFFPKTLHNEYSMKHVFPEGADNPPRSVISRVIITSDADPTHINAFPSTNINEISYEGFAPLPKSMCTPRIRILNIMHNINIKNIKYCTNLLELSINLTSRIYHYNDLIFNESIVNVANCTKLKKFIFDAAYEEPITFLAPCKDLEVLSLRLFDQSIEPIKNCIKLKDVNLGEDFNQSIEYLSACTQLENLQLGASFNQPIDTLINCHNLKRLNFGRTFNHSINVLQNCPQLEYLSFGGNSANRFNESAFNQPITSLSYCKKLKELYFGSEFNQSIDALSACTNLRILYLGYKFNQFIDALGECILLNRLHFGYHFNQSIDALANCISLRTLLLGISFDQAVSKNVYFPQSLLNIEFGDSFNQSIEFLTHCIYLQNIVFGRRFNQSLRPLIGLLNETRITLPSRFRKVNKHFVDSFLREFRIDRNAPRIIFYD
jgi:hypothetical protein